MKKALLFHDGCNICLSISESASRFIDTDKYHFESINLGVNNERGQEAKDMGVKRLPSLVIDGKVMKIDDHSSIEDYLIKNGTKV